MISNGRFFALAIAIYGCIVLIDVHGFTHFSPRKIAINKIGHASATAENAFQVHNKLRPQRYRPTVFSLKDGNDNGVPSSPLDRPVLSAIDATSLMIFAGIGKASHSAVDGSLDITAVLTTAFPFLLSWFLVSPLVGSYTPEATKDVQSAAIQSAKGWILAVPMGCILRGIIKGYVPPLPFVIVTMISTLVILTIGRVGYTALAEVYVEMF